MNTVEKYASADNQFYPTPESFLEQIYQDFYKQISFFNAEGKYAIKVLEPSAGKGDIAKFLENKGNDSWSKMPRCDIECIEIDPTLQATLKGLDFVVVYNDFLSFDTYTKYDLIFMNPPFVEADKHLMKAISMQKRYGGRIICILNAETLKNPYSKIRKGLNSELEKYQAIIKYYDSPFCAYDSERTTNASVAVVWLDIPTPESAYSSLIFDKMDAAKKVETPTPEQAKEQNELIKLGLDWISAFVKQYNEQVTATLSFFKEYDGFRLKYSQRFANVETESVTYKPPFELKVYGKELTDINVYLEIVRKHYWQTLFANPKFSGRLTSKLRNELFSRIKQFAHYDFTEHNILVLMQENMNATVKGIEDAIIELFDELTKHAQYDGCANIHYYNGWKTNSAHKLNRKVIIPFYRVWKRSPRYVYHKGACGYCTQNGYQYRLNFHEAYDTLSDMAKTLNYLANGICGLEVMSNLSATINQNFENGNAKNIKLAHFTVTFYKKGTCHITFNSEALLEKFNLFASKKKGWLPPSYGKKSYQSMDAEEKELVKEFSGSEENYNMIFEHQEQFLVEDGSALLLSAANEQ